MDAVYNETEVPAYTLPDALARMDGSHVTTVTGWTAWRTSLVEQFAHILYGTAPEALPATRIELKTESPECLSGRATMKQVGIQLSGNGRSIELDLLLLIPNQHAYPVPAFLGLNFYGNHTIHPDPGILLHRSWSGNNEAMGITGNRATEAARGCRAHRWPVGEIIDRGYALATVYAGDIDPDFDDGFRNGVHALFTESDYSMPQDARWGTIGAWAWGLSRVLDYLIAGEPHVDGERVMAIGHSRMGKTALWAAATDQRFAAAIANGSGCSGAALHRRCFGERLHHLNARFPHWLCDRAKSYNGRESALPVDQHQLIAAIAPRPVYVSSAVEDRWADPKGEFLGLIHAGPVYRLLGVEGVASPVMPAVNERIRGALGYHIRPGEHDLLASDWRHFMDFADAEVRDRQADPAT